MMIRTIFQNYWYLVVIGLFFIIVGAFILGNVIMNRMIERDINALFNNHNKEISRISEKDLEGLPSPVEKWLIYTNVIGQPRIHSVYFSQRGEMRLNPDDTDWMDPEAIQYVRVDEPAYLWHVRIPLLPFVSLRGVDNFVSGEASMQMKLGGLIPVVNAKDNAKLNESSLHRFLLEMPWYPTAALEDYMTWESIDETQAKGIITYQSITVSAIFTFDESGRLLHVEALRYKEHDDFANRLVCIGTVQGYTEVEGFKIPNRFDVTWFIDNEPFTWYKLENHDITYQIP